MATADELFEQMEENPEEFIEPINDILVINPETRIINVPATERLFGVLEDQNSERKYFKCPKIVGDNIDLSKHRIFIKYIQALDKDGTKFVEEEPELRVCEDVAVDGDYITFSWKLSGNVYKKDGFVAFSVFAMDGESVTWGTIPAIGIVAPTIPGGIEEIAELNSDIINQLLDRMNALEKADGGNTIKFIETEPEAESDTTYKIGMTDETYLVGDMLMSPSYKLFEVTQYVDGIGYFLNLTSSINVETSGKVTSEIIKNALGYTPANQTKVAELESNLEGKEEKGTAESKVSEHNVATDAHNDIRMLVQGLMERLNALADSDDETLDQMSEVVAYIKSNKSLIDAITTSKVSVSDIIDNLTTNVSNKPLSAAQGVALKALIDGIIIPKKLSELENDSGYAKTTDIPDKLPNPQKLTFSGAVIAEYDGSKPVSVEIPSGGNGGAEVTEAVKIAEFTINAEMAEATSIKLTAEEYPTMKDYNVLWLSLDNYANGSSPWIQLSINDKVIYKIGTSANNGFRNVIHSRNGYFFAYGDVRNPSLIPNDPYNIDIAISISFISEAWKYVGELSSIKLGSYTKFMKENAKISLYGWNE